MIILQTTWNQLVSFGLFMRFVVTMTIVGDKKMEKIEIKKVIASKPLTYLYEMNSNCIIVSHCTVITKNK